MLCWTLQISWFPCLYLFLTCNLSIGRTQCSLINFVNMPCCLPFTLFTCRFKKNKVVDKCFPHKSNTNVLVLLRVTKEKRYFFTLETGDGCRIRISYLSCTFSFSFSFHSFAALTYEIFFNTWRQILYLCCG